jgi:transposase-like protein
MTPHQPRNYVLYHDCISMDSTFGTNRFRMPLVLVVGVDGEGRTILLGSGLLSDEMSGSYEWLFEQLREAGHMLQPGVIFTDGDPVFPDAIATVFPSTRHYLCAWHLSQSMIRTAAPKLGSHLPTLMSAFSRCRKIPSVDEFEQAWQSVLSMHEMAPAADYLAGLTRTKASTGGCAAAASRCGPRRRMRL